MAQKPVHATTTEFGTQSTNHIVSGEHDMGEKVETLENIIADKLRAISDLDSKLQKNRRGAKTKQSNSVEQH